MCGIWAIFGSDVDVDEHVQSCFKIKHRGPDCFRFENVNHFENCAFGFHRLAIVDDRNGMQPIRVPELSHIWMIYNGEIYNHKEIQKKYNFQYATACDGESLIHLYNKGGAKFMAEQLYGIFGFILFDTKTKTIYCGRDTFGVRPLFKLTSENSLGLCSEAKGLIEMQKVSSVKTELTEIIPGVIEEYQMTDGNVKFISETRFGSIGTFPKYDLNIKLNEVVANTPNSAELISQNIRNLITNAVRMRLMSMRRIGCMLSGGLDSSLIAGVLVKEAKLAGIEYPIQTFSIGMNKESPDIIAARKVAEYLQTEHHEIMFSGEDIINCIEQVIESLETYDITTIRASICMYLISKYIKENTDTTVIFSGEGADEICQGYIYFYKAPSYEEAHKDSQRLCDDLYLYDIKRADRTTAAHGLELRVPFLDHAFASYYMSLNSETRMPTEKHCEKFLLRNAFNEQGYIPQEILWRRKEAFSDGVASQTKSLFKYLQEHIEPQISDDQFANAKSKFPFNTPMSKEAFYYRSLFEQMYPKCDKFTPYMWMPKWCGQQIDPSARVLNHYKTSNER